MGIHACEEMRRDDVKEYLSHIRTSVQRGAGITRQLLTFGRQNLAAEEVLDMTALVRDQFTLLKPLTDASVKMELNIPKDSIYVECAPDSIGNILMNLVVNSKDAMPEGGSIAISLKSCDPENLPALIPEEQRNISYACLTIEDTGEGIPQEIIGKIFEPFFSTKQPGKGTGLGLSMVYGLVKEMNGYIDIHSKSREGTSFSVYLPVSSRKAKKKITGNLEDIKNLSFTGYTAMVVEDEADLLVLVADLLERLGMKVLKACNGNEALVLLDEYEGEIDILLTDVVMPELDGIKLAELMHSFRPDTEVIFMSGYPSGGHMAKFEVPENACLLDKPVNERDLVSRIFQLVDERYKDEKKRSG
jgi:CheY-like chemotaxis protein